MRLLEPQERAAIVVALVADTGTGPGQSVRVICTPNSSSMRSRLMSQILLPPMLYRKDRVVSSTRCAPATSSSSARPSRARSGDTAENHVRYQQHSALPGRRSGRPPGRRCAQPVERDAMCATVATSSRGGGIAVWERQSWWALPATTFRPGTILGSHGHSHTRAINSCQRRESNRSGLPPVRAPGVGGKERGRHWRSPTRRETALRLP